MNYSLKEVLGTNIFSYIHPDFQQHCMAFFNELTGQQINSYEVEYSLISKDGLKIDIEGHVIVKFENKHETAVRLLNTFLFDLTHETQPHRFI